MLLRSLLVIALTLAGTVPVGMMRVSGGEGLRLVLCTPDGTQEVWLADDGTVTPVDEPGEDDSRGRHPSHCVQITLFADGSGAVLSAPHALSLRPADSPPTAHQTTRAPAPKRPNLSRAPPVPA